MTINKERIEELLNDNFEMCSDPFDDFEADHIFYNGEDDFHCDRASTSGFRTSVSNFEVEIDDNKSVYICGTGSASYHITGSIAEYDDEDCYGYLDEASDEGSASISFTIYVDPENYINSDVDVEVR